MTLTMGPLQNHRQGVHDESTGKALLLQSFISNTSDSSGPGNQEQLNVEPIDGQQVTLTRVQTNLTSFVVTLKDKQVECQDPFHDVKIKRHPVRNHEMKARIALALIFVFIGLMAVFAFMTLKKHSEKMAADSASSGIIFMALHNSSNATDLSGNTTDNTYTNTTTDTTTTPTLQIGKL